MPSEQLLRLWVLDEFLQEAHHQHKHQSSGDLGF
ncbi:hypothetical protein C8E84_1616 [Ornithinibacter aureus]|uniref:Uncharacterized protein n=1 Tax=Nocardioides panzhihuensis TaxID=860243 RepID=A0A7Z0IVN2_9ACTN|nr:hypothetical protein C8E84_1616 [Ornithinibacter aureus]NYI81172.1 hypothetical protein [Nocardioides panzhihuensis]